MKHRSKFRYLCTGLLPILLGVLAVGGLLLAAQPAFAATNGPTTTGEICMQQVFGTPVTSSNLLNCTANDIRLSRATSVSPSTCIEGSTFTLTATFETNVTANSRYDAGFFFRIDGGTNARGDGSNATGTCSLSQLNNSSPAQNLDGDTCGDLNSGVYELTFTIPNVLCHDSDGDGFLNLPNCTSWHSNQGTACAITDSAGAKPDTKSKCVCDDTFQVPVIVETASLTVVKAASPTSVPETGGDVTYTVSVENAASFVSVTITDISDNLYGDLSGDATGSPPCASLIGKVLAPGGSASCSFVRKVSGDTGQKITDIVEVCGDDNASHHVCGHDDADVTITDVAKQPGLSKTATGATFKVDVTYVVVVTNNSAIDTLTVNSLTDDKFGDITQVQGNVISTDCANGGTINPNSNYTCSFVGRITTSPHMDTVTASVTDDDNVTSSPFDNATVTVDIQFP